jgi:hypothetical protein
VRLRGRAARRGRRREREGQTNGAGDCDEREMRRVQWHGERYRATGALSRATVGVYGSAAGEVQVRRERAKSSTSFRG